MAEPQPKAGSGGWWIVMGVVGLLVMVGMCSSPDDEVTQSFASPTLSEQIQGMPSPTATAIASLNLASVRTARRHLRVVTEAEGLPGAMIYSQNCYDALSREFSWEKLDQCGGFDLMSVRAVDAMSVDGLDTEVDYFGSEAAAGRYLAVATKGGELPEDADVRLQRLQREVEKLSPSQPVEAPEPAEVIVPDDSSDEAPLGIEAEEGAA